MDSGLKKVEVWIVHISAFFFAKSTKIGWARIHYKESEMEVLYFLIAPAIMIIYDQIKIKYLDKKW